MALSKRCDGCLSAKCPPTKYPTLSAARNTVIKLPHTKIELPKWGASTRLPAISSPINTAPAQNTSTFSRPLPLPRLAEISVCLAMSSGDRVRSDFTVLVPFDAIDSVPIARMLLRYFYCDPIGQTEQHETEVAIPRSMLE